MNLEYWIRLDTLKNIEELELGDHVAFFFRDRAEQLATMIPYIKVGLERNERCLYITSDNSVPMIVRRLEEGGVNVNEAQKRGALVVATKGETYLAHGVFEPEKMISELRDQVRMSLSMGFAGLRATGETTWALDLPSALTSLLDYELSLDREYPASFLAVCQYDETRFPEAIVRDVAAIHPVVIRNGVLIRNRALHSEPSHPAGTVLGASRTTVSDPRFIAAAG